VEPRTHARQGSDLRIVHRVADALLIGSPKSGTTTLAAWLDGHPDMSLGREKEIRYFSHFYDRGPRWYADQFPSVPVRTRLLDATPVYLADPAVAPRVAADLPNARFLAIVREPVARAWSNFWFFVSLGVESRSWERAIQDELDGAEVVAPYLSIGRFGEQLDRWESHVGVGRTKVLLFDDIVQRPVETVAAALRFLDLDPAPAPALIGRDALNPTRLPRSIALQRAMHWMDNAGVSQRVLQRSLRWNAGGRPVPSMPDSERQRLLPLFAADRHRLLAHLDGPLPARWS
jgi:hypothetical protein